MTPKDVRDRVEAIGAGRGPGAYGWDDELAHSAEDSLWVEVLKAIADGAPDADRLAREALRTTEIGFSRWYA